MNDMLRAHCGPYGLLLDINNVLEVAPLGDSVQHSTHRIWRDLRIPFVDLHARLGLPHPEKSQQIVVEVSADDNSQVFVMDVDEVRDIVSINQSDCAVLPLEDKRLGWIVKFLWCDVESSQFWLGLDMNVSRWCFDESIPELDTYE